MKVVNLSGKKWIHQLHPKDNQETVKMKILAEIKTIQEINQDEVEVARKFCSDEEKFCPIKIINLWSLTQKKEMIDVVKKTMYFKKCASIEKFNKKKIQVSPIQVAEEISKFKKKEAFGKFTLDERLKKKFEAENTKRKAKD